MRRCPLCGQKSQSPYCARDQIATLRVARCSHKTIRHGAELNRRYHIGDVIGTGAVGQVFEAKDTSNGKRVAIKVMLPVDDEAGKRATVRFVREAAITANLVDPHTVAMLSYGQTEHGEFFAVMEHLNGESLAKRLERFRQRGRPLHASEVVKVTASVLKSLAEAHGHGLVHRDIKPANIIFHRVDKHEAVKLIDFGMVRTAGSQLTDRGAALGTPAYMSPEQAGGFTIDARSDLYALGCVMYECIAGRPPFMMRGNPIAVMQAHIREAPKPLALRIPTVEPALAALVDVALAKDPGDRFQTAQIMLRALRSMKLNDGQKRAELAAAHRQTYGDDIHDDPTQVFDPGAVDATQDPADPC